MKKQNTVSFAEIFDYAVNMKLAHWNKCCDILFSDGLLKYGGVKEIYKSDLEYELEPESDSGINEDGILATKILIQFMTHNKIKKMLVLGT